MRSQKTDFLLTLHNLLKSHYGEKAELTFVNGGISVQAEGYDQKIFLIYSAEEFKEA